MLRVSRLLLRLEEEKLIEVISGEAFSLRSRLVQFDGEALGSGVRASTGQQGQEGGGKTNDGCRNCRAGRSQCRAVCGNGIPAGQSG